MAVNRLTWAGVGFLCALIAHGPALRAEGVIEVEVGQTIERPWDEVKADGFAYAPKQVVEGEETRIYLPYGNDPLLYAEVHNGVLSDAKIGGGMAGFQPKDSTADSWLTFKLQFDKPIRAFRYKDGWTEIVLKGSSVAGVEYSVDGKEWKPLREVKAGQRFQNPAGKFIDKDARVEGLNTDTLYIRRYARIDGGGGSSWHQFRLSGDPAWGDAAVTFSNAQHQVWVTPAE